MYYILHGVLQKYKYRSTTCIRPLGVLVQLYVL